MGRRYFCVSVGVLASAASTLGIMASGPARAQSACVALSPVDGCANTNSGGGASQASASFQLISGAVSVDAAFACDSFPGATAYGATASVNGKPVHVPVLFVQSPAPCPALP
jgi:hypothetical protein